jgi:transposase
VKPLLQDRTPRRTRCPRVSDGAASTAIVFMLATEIPLRLVPQQIACPRVSAWRRLWEWQRVGCGRDYTASFSAA